MGHSKTDQVSSNVPSWQHMSRWSGLEVDAEGTGISAPLSRQVNLLGSLLGRALREQGGQELLDLVESLRLKCKQAARTNDPAPRHDAAARIAELDYEQIRWLLRTYTAFFHLVNKAEQQEIIRINRQRAREAGGGLALRQTDGSAERTVVQPEPGGQPRSESINEAVARLAERGVSFDEAADVIGRLDIQPTLTAHPTEARRRSILFKQQHIAAQLAKLRRGDPTPEEQGEALDGIYNDIVMLLATDEIRSERPTVIEEVAQGLYFMQGAIWETVPRIHRDVRRFCDTVPGSGPTATATRTSRPVLRGGRWRCSAALR